MPQVLKMLPRVAFRICLAKGDEPTITDQSSAGMVHGVLDAKDIEQSHAQNRASSVLCMYRKT